jgi:hypothetical protein
MFEGTMLLSRAAVETCIVGLYWLNSEDAGEQLTAANANSLRKMMRFLTDASVLSETVVEEAVKLIGDPAPASNYFKMAKDMRADQGDEFSFDTYRRIYVPLCEMFAHPTGVTLLRHVDSEGRIVSAPQKWWTRRAAVHTADACVAMLAAVIAKKAGQDPVPFAVYGQAHANRMHPTVLTIVIGTLRREVKLRETIKALRAIRAVRAESGRYAQAATDEEREAVVREALADGFAQLSFSDGNEMLNDLLRVLVPALVASDSETRQPSLTAD